jgi:hypothetical protein
MPRFQGADRRELFCVLSVIQGKSKKGGRERNQTQPGVLFSPTPIPIHLTPLVFTFLQSINLSITYISITPTEYTLIQFLESKTYIKMLASILFALLPIVSAIVTPTTPDGSTVINEGASIDAVWTADTTGEWTNMTIQLMTGDNLSVSLRFKRTDLLADTFR